MEGDNIGMEDDGVDLDDDSVSLEDSLDDAELGRSSSMVPCARRSRSLDDAEADALWKLCPACWAQQVWRDSVGNGPHARGIALRSSECCEY